MLKDTLQSKSIIVEPPLGLISTSGKLAGCHVRSSPSLPLQGCLVRLLVRGARFQRDVMVDVCVLVFASGLNHLHLPKRER